MWAGLNGYDPRTDLVLDGVRIGIGCMNLLTVISRYTRVPVTLIVVGFHWHHEPSFMSVHSLPLPKLFGMTSFRIQIKLDIPLIDSCYSQQAMQCYYLGDCNGSFSLLER